MTFQKKCFLIFVFGLFNFLLIVGFLIIRDNVLEYNLRKEINELSELDITKDRFNSDLKTSGNYVLVEEAIKLYLDDYAVYLQDVLNVINSEEFRGLFSLDNYKNDGPEFNNSLNYIEKTKNKFNSDILFLIDKSNEDSIKNNILSYTRDNYYVSLYEQLMLGDEKSIDFEKNIIMLNNLQDEVNNVFSVSVSMFEFLSLNRENYTIENGEIKFKTQELLNQYNIYINKIK